MMSQMWYRPINTQSPAGTYNTHGSLWYIYETQWVYRCKRALNWRVSRDLRGQGVDIDLTLFGWVPIMHVEDTQSIDPALQVDVGL